MVWLSRLQKGGMWICVFLLPSIAWAEQYHTKQTQSVEHLQEPLYNPFIERYTLDELKKLREDMNRLEVSLTKEVVDREMAATTRAVSYATDTITYFFYLIAGISSVLVLVGWNSIRDVKEKMMNLADNKIENVVAEYEARLEKLEEELNRKSRGISNAQKRLSQHQDVYSLWLRAGQEQILSNKLRIYDQILEIDPENTEAMTYKADVALDMGEPHWALNLCYQALALEPENKHAFYQLASAYAQLGMVDDALKYLEKSLAEAEGKAVDLLKDPHLQSLFADERFQALLMTYDSEYKAV